jgi:hypothetical protein
MLYRQPGFGLAGLWDFAEKKQGVFVNIHVLKFSLPDALGSRAGCPSALHVRRY